MNSKMVNMCQVPLSKVGKRKQCLARNSGICELVDTLVHALNFVTRMLLLNNRQ